MQVVYKNVTGTQAARPETVDKTSSPHTVYLRKNITRTTIAGQDGTSHKGWNYEEAELTKEEYEEYESQLTQPAVVQAAENSNDIMAAVADVYEQLTQQYVALSEAIVELYETGV